METRSMAVTPPDKRLSQIARASMLRIAPVTSSVELLSVAPAFKTIFLERHSGSASVYREWFPHLTRDRSEQRFGDFAMDLAEQSAVNAISVIFFCLHRLCSFSR